jgi:tRNA (cmo5U34)-methyltransferase
VTVRAVFDASAGRYDRLRRQLIPCFDDFYQTAVEIIPFEPSEPIRVLDLGAGTGLMSSFVLDAFPQAHLTLVDVSDEMLARARERFVARQGQVDFVIADYSRFDLPGGYDLVVSALSIHHLADEDKAALFSRVRGMLVHGGAFVNADQMLGSTPTTDRRYVDTWLQRVRASGITAEDLAQMFERTSYDRLTDLETQLGWLRDAGFSDVDCYYKWHNFAVYSGRRGEGTIGN